METMQGFEVEMEKGDVLMPWDFKSGYWHFAFLPDIRNFFLSWYAGCNYVPVHCITV